MTATAGNIDRLIDLAGKAQQALTALDREASDLELGRLDFGELGALIVCFDGLYSALDDATARVHNARNDRETAAQKLAALHRSSR